MSVEQYRRIINGLDKDIANLEKKKVAKDKEVSDLQQKMAV